jgi:hypothetical protein
MTSIQSLGSGQSISQLLMKAGVGKTPQMPTASSSGSLPSLNITNDKGQSLLDIRDQMQSAVASALQGLEPGQDVRSAVEGALDETLRENGFDPDEVKSAMDSFGGPDAMRQMMGGGGMPGGGMGDLSSSLFSSGNEEDLVQSFLKRLQAGTNLDLSI